MRGYGSGMTDAPSRGVRPPRLALEGRLEEELLSGRLAAGEQLPSERVLAERYNVSRPIVREVLRSLQERGLLDVVPGRGTFVRPPRVADGARPLDSFYRRRNATPREVAEARIMVETVTAAAAARLATPEDLDELRVTLERFDQADTVIGKARQDIVFHATIARIARNSVIEVMFASVSGLAFEQMLRSLADPEVVRAGEPFHRQIYEAIREHDPARASQAMLEHLSVAQRLYGADYDASLDALARREIERLGPAVSLDHLLNEVFEQVAPDR
jgi:GntR family transcriptional regulator, transcriptional repressor for pyruvate dehydrogenase complex